MADQDTVCSSCGARLESAPARPAPPPAEPLPPAPEPEAAASPPVPEPRAMCSKHPDKPMAGVCKRCGTFYCSECEPTASDGQPITCLPCRKLTAPADLKKVLNEFLISSVLLALLLGGAPLLLVVVLGANARGVVFTVIGVLAGLFTVVIGTALRVTGLPLFAWVLLGFEVLTFGGLAMMAPGLITIVLLIAIVGFTFRSAVRLGELRQLTKGTPAPGGGIIAP